MSYEANVDLDAGAAVRVASASAAPASWFGQLVDGLNAIGSVVIGLVMLLMCVDVLMRNAVDRPIDGVAELVATSIIVIVFLQLPSTLRHGRMSRAELFIDPFLERKPRAGRRLRALYSLVGALSCAVIAYATWPAFERAWQDSEFWGVEGIFTFPTWPVRAVVILGSVLAAVQYLLFVVQDLAEAGHE